MERIVDEQVRGGGTRRKSVPKRVLHSSQLLPTVLPKCPILRPPLLTFPRCRIPALTREYYVRAEEEAPPTVKSMARLRRNTSACLIVSVQPMMTTRTELESSPVNAQSPMRALLLPKLERAQPRRSPSQSPCPRSSPLHSPSRRTPAHAAPP